MLKEHRIQFKVVSVLLIALWGFFFFRLGYIQIFRRGYYASKARKQSVEKIVVYPDRGKIYDRNGKLIATNLKTKTLVAFPQKMDDKNQAAAMLAKYGYGSFDNLSRDFAHEHFMYIKRNLETVPAKEIKDLEGVELLQDKKRYYPYGEVCASVVGFVGTEYTGLEGLEFEFDTLLAGKPGWAHLQKSPMGYLYPHPALPVQEPSGGKDIVLTIDVDIQSIVLSELEKVLKTSSAEGGIVIVIDPQTGEILAMVNLPGYDPNHALQYEKERWINRAICELFEPGSTFKIVAATAAIEEKLFNLNDIVEAGEGEISIGKVKITDAEEHGALTFVEFVQHSSNCAAVRIAEKVGKKRFYCYERAYGFGSRTKVRLPGEERGNIGDPGKWTALKFATMSFGQGVSVTALQLIFAYAAIANEGVLTQPSIVRAILSSEGDTLYKAEPVYVRRVMQIETSLALREILVGVVNYGTGRFAKIDGIEIAGKTGTAEKSDPVIGYEKGSYVASFVGFVPVQNPRLLIGVFIDEPKGMHWGGYVAAPLFRKIAERILLLDGYQKKIVTELVAKNTKMEPDETVKGN
jgi:cell division protein FtsI (penicillin-binding protein 3)